MSIEQPGLNEQEEKAQHAMSRRQETLSEMRETSFETIKAETGEFGRLEIRRDRDPNGRAVWRLEGDIKGHVISLKCDSQWGPIASGTLNKPAFFMGTVNGEELTMNQAHRLWNKYSGMAYEVAGESDPPTKETRMGTLVDFLLE